MERTREHGAPQTRDHHNLLHAVQLAVAGRLDGAGIGGFPDVKTLKQKVRDLIDSERDLGHIDR